MLLINSPTGGRTKGKFIEAILLPLHEKEMDRELSTFDTIKPNEESALSRVSSK